MRLVLILLPIALAGCGESAVQREERKLTMMKSAGAKPDEICKQMRAVTAAYLEAGDQDGYRFHKTLSDSDCLTAEIDRDFRNGVRIN